MRDIKYITKEDNMPARQVSKQSAQFSKREPGDVNEPQ